ncbi:hypothetical protein E4S40_15405 [Algoriphagus kandeliae]|uniref:Uncharacterized protein n=1 Tax=Algoriphagus kandeliae TaxID=2562278 RepID=A0A4Y9QP30_9BACT|nr:DUF6090 family protein [Algoriphagus kandeliae]TFV93628.1 hypothetical protein E4S40_15405 [Algoriphagus kandeliae]
MNTKYFKYALGEIVLVVIGILIALSINNWNEERKSSLLELKLLKEVEVSMKEDSLLLNNAIARMQRQSRIAEGIRAHFSQRKAYHDTLDTSFGRVSFLFNTQFSYAAYESLTLAGLNLIRNDSLRLQLPDYYHFLKNIEEVGQEFDLPVYFRTTIYPKYFNSFSWGEDGAHPADYDRLLNSSDFMVALDYVRNDSRFYTNNYKEIYSMNQKLLKMIRTELKSRE